VDRTILPGIPAGEDAGAVVGVDPDNTEHNRSKASSKASSKAKLAKNRDGRIKGRAAPQSARTGGRITDPVGVPEGPTGPNSVVRAP